MRQIDRQRRQDLDPRAGFFERVAAVADQAFGEMALAGAAVFGALLLAVHQHLGLRCPWRARRGRPCRGAPSSRAPSEPRARRCAAHPRRAQDRLRRGPARHRVLRRMRPRAAEDGDADGGQFDDAIDALQQRAVVAGDENAALPAFEQLGDGLRGHRHRDCWWARPAAAGPAPRSAGAPAPRACVRRRSAKRSGDQRQSGQAGFDQCRVRAGLPASSRLQRHRRASLRRVRAGASARDLRRRRALRRPSRRSSASCASMPIEPMRCTDPLAGSISPAISRSSVDLPQPLRPTTPVRSRSERQRQSVEQRASVRRGEGNGIQNEKCGHGELPKWTGVAARSALRCPFQSPCASAGRMMAPDRYCLET